jgi:hypothetical protein
MKAKDAGRVNEGIRAATARAVRETNKDSLTDSLRGLSVGGVLAFDLENYYVVVGNEYRRHHIPRRLCRA